MKLTWFAGTTIRIHIGGQVLVADAASAPEFVQRDELVSGADREFTLVEPDRSVPPVDPAGWRARPVPRLVDEERPLPVLLHALAQGAVLVDASGEPPLVLLTTSAVPRLGRWAGDAVVVLFGCGPALVEAGRDLLNANPPRLVALAADEPTVDLAIADLGPLLDGTALVALEPGLALEV